ncbi:MAG: alpha/beta hydrolase [Balneolaceae bacterium]
MKSLKTILSTILVCLFITMTTQAQTENVIIDNDGVPIGGTLQFPEEGTSNRLVIMISGSGAQDRDETILGFKPFQVIAEDLAKSGTASYRYDDRQVGESAGIFTEATLDILASDVDAIINYFNSEHSTTYDEFILLGHSQGGMVGTYAASRNELVSGLILMASPIVPLKDVIDSQITIMQKAMGKTDADIATTLEFQKEAYEAVRTNSGWDELKVSFQTLLEDEIAKLPLAQQQMITDMDAFAEAQFNQQVSPIRTPQMRSLMFYDAGNDLARLKIPVLGLFGGKDTQVPLDQNGTRFDEICKDKGGQCQNTTFSEANHLFQKANSGLAMEYASLAKEFIEGFTESINTWIASN